MDIINLELYRIFYIVALTGNFSRAAESMYTGQPSISKSIKKLEDLLQVKLFNRNSKGVTLTGEGEVLFEYVSSAMQKLNAGELAVKKSTELTQGKLTLGVSTILYEYFIFPHLKGFLEQHNNFTVNIVDNSMSHEIIEAIKKGSIDLGMISKPLDVEGIDFIPITTVEEVMVADPVYLSKFDTSNLETFFKRVTLLYLKEGNVARDYNELYLSSLGVDFRPEIVTSSMKFIIELVSLGVGIGIVYKEAIKIELEQHKLVELNFLPSIPKREIGIALKKDELRTFAIEEFVNYYKAKFGR